MSVLSRPTSAYTALLIGLPLLIAAFVDAEECPLAVQGTRPHTVVLMDTGGSSPVWVRELRR